MITDPERKYFGECHPDYHTEEHNNGVYKNEEGRTMSTDEFKDHRQRMTRDPEYRALIRSRRMKDKAITELTRVKH